MARRDGWRRLVAFGFRLLYNELAWLYDPVSWLTSLGLWRTYQRIALDYLPAAGTVLEVGFGPGHLLTDLARRGYRPMGLDLSRAMLRQAQRRHRRQGLTIPLCRGRAGDLPFAAAAFDAIVSTFPTSYVYDLNALQEMERVLRPGGRLVVVEEFLLQQRDLAGRGLEQLYQLTGQRGPVPDLVARMNEAGLDAERLEVQAERSLVILAVARKRTQVSSPIG
jgi:ubiquinone/menaquinone biosynthesis C-methylase UbiE